MADQISQSLQDDIEGRASITHGALELAASALQQAREKLEEAALAVATAGQSNDAITERLADVEVLPEEPPTDPPDPPPPPPPPDPSFSVDGATVTWTEVPGATRYKLAYRQGSGAGTGYVGDPLTAPRSSYTFQAVPSGLVSPFEVAWAWYDGSDHWTGGWKPIEVGATVPPVPPDEPDPPSPPPSGGSGTLLWSEGERQVTVSSGEHAADGDYNRYLRVASGTNKPRRMLHRFGASFPASWRWSSGGFKMSGPGGESSGGVVPNGCTSNNGWSARQQWDGAGSGGLPSTQARIAAYVYAQNVASRPAYEKVETGCGTILRNTGSGVVSAGDRVDTEQEIDLDAGRLILRWSRNGGPMQTLIDHDGIDFGSFGLSHSIPVVYFGGTNVSPQTQTMTMHYNELYRLD